MFNLHEYYLAACKALGKTPVPVLEDRSDLDKVSSDARDRLVICIRFKNMIDGKIWIPIYDGTEWHYYVVVTPNETGLGFSGTHYDGWYTYADVGARLEYRTRDLCKEGLKEFEAYYIDYHAPIA